MMIACRSPSPDELTERRHPPGLSLAVASAATTRHDGYGLADVEHGPPAAPDTGQGPQGSNPRFCVQGAPYGGLIGSSADAAHFLRLHLGANGSGESAVISPGGIAAMQTLTARGAQARRWPRLVSPPPRRGDDR